MLLVSQRGLQPGSTHICTCIYVYIGSKEIGIDGFSMCLSCIQSRYLEDSQAGVEEEVQKEKTREQRLE